MQLFTNIILFFIILDTTKSESFYRIIPLIDEMITEHKTHIQMQNTEKQTSGLAYSGKNFLFCNEIREPYDIHLQQELLDNE